MISSGLLCDRMPTTLQMQWIPHISANCLCKFSTSFHSS